MPIFDINTAKKIASQLKEKAVESLPMGVSPQPYISDSPDQEIQNKAEEIKQYARNLSYNMLTGANRSDISGEELAAKIAEKSGGGENIQKAASFAATAVPFITAIATPQPPSVAERGIGKGIRIIEEETPKIGKVIEKHQIETAANAIKKSKFLEAKGGALNFLKEMTEKNKQP